MRFQQITAIFIINNLIIINDWLIMYIGVLKLNARVYLKKGVNMKKILYFKERTYEK